MTLSSAPRVSPRGGELRLEVRVPVDRLLARLGCSPDDVPSTRLLHGIDRAAGGIVEDAEPRVVYRAFPVSHEHGRPRVGGGPVFDSSKLAEALISCDRVLVFALTLGERIDRLIRRSTGQNMSFGCVLDAAASVAVDALADRFQAEIDRAILPGEATGLRFSPGYCDWPLREQEKLFALLPPRPAGISLSSDFLMSPRKSISGVMGIGRREAVAATVCPCRRCARLHCDHRRAPLAPSLAERLRAEVRVRHALHPLQASRGGLPDPLADRGAERPRMESRR